MNMKIEKICHICGSRYFVFPYRAKSSKYCSRKCSDDGQRTSQRKTISCEHCGDTFNTTKDHGVWPRFCSRACFGANAVHPEEKECGNCGMLFVADRASHRTSHDTDDGRRKYCSVKCRHEGLKKGSISVCVNCGGEFYLRNTRHDRCCSDNCMREFYIGGNSPAWKGGNYIDCYGRKINYFPRPDRKAKHVLEHRVVVMRYIGRLLHNTEVVMHLDGNRKNNKQGNLYICESYREFRRYKDSRKMWPKQSNLDAYLVKEVA